MLEKIVSGGQTGVDRAALDAALELRIPCGGWCPQHRKAADGRIPERYPLTETGSHSYSQRTEWNVRDSDATLILNKGALEGGTRLTVQCAQKTVRPCLIVDLDAAPDPAQLAAWLHKHRVRILNVAGPREEKCPGIHAQALKLLQDVLQ